MSTSNWVFSFLQIADGMNVTHIDTVVCDAALLANYINTTDAATLEGLSETLCELSDPEVIDLVSTIQSELDAKAILLEFEDEANECAVTKACPMEIPMDTIIKDWQVISDYFVEVLGTDEATMLSLRHSTFIVPEVCCMKQACRSPYRMHEKHPQIILNGGNNPDTVEEAVCNPVLLSEYIFLPFDPPDPDFSLVDLSRSLCRELNHSQSLDLAAIVLEQMNVKSVLESVLDVRVENIFARANVSRDEGERALGALASGITAVTVDHAGDVEALAEAFNGTYNEEYTAAMHAGLVLCGNPDALVLNINWPEDEGADDGGGGGGGEGGGGDGGNGTEPAYDQCRNLMTQLGASTAGSYAWVTCYTKNS